MASAASRLKLVWSMSKPSPLMQTLAPVFRMWSRKAGSRVRAVEAGLPRVEVGDDDEMFLGRLDVHAPGSCSSGSRAMSLAWTAPQAGAQVVEHLEGERRVPP